MDRLGKSTTAEVIISKDSVRVLEDIKGQLSRTGKHNLVKQAKRKGLENLVQFRNSSNFMDITFGARGLIQPDKLSLNKHNATTKCFESYKRQFNTNRIG